MNDTNRQNHAYIKNRSCLTAVVDVQQKLLKRRIEWYPDRNLGAPKTRLVQAISADDIASAFESIDHEAVSMVVERSFARFDDLKIGKMIREYLRKRKCTAINSSSSDRFEINRAFGNKTSPQGSLISPKLWRIYDSLFTDFYEEGLKVMVR